MEWYELKQIVVAWSGFSKNMLHLVGGAGIFLCLALIFRKKSRLWLAWLVLLCLELFNEALDYEGARRTGNEWVLSEQLSDIIWTMAIPTLIAAVLTARRRQRPALADGGS